jgi:hypothetical protein
VSRERKQDVRCVLDRAGAEQWLDARRDHVRRGAS